MQDPSAAMAILVMAADFRPPLLSKLILFSVFEIKFSLSFKSTAVLDIIFKGLNDLGQGYLKD